MALNTPVDLQRHVNGGTQASAPHWHPAVAESLAGLPIEPMTCWGIPFTPAAAGGEGEDPPRWLLLGRSHPDNVPIDLPAGTQASHVVFLHFCDDTYDPAAGSQPEEYRGGNLTQPGAQVANYVLAYADGSEERREIRVRFEINDSGTVRGQKAFAARPDGQDDYIDFRATHPGEAWGRAQMSASQGSGQYWVYALPNPRPEAELRGVRLEAAGDAVVAIAGITLYHGQEHPLKRKRLESFRITLAANGTAAEDVALAVDLGILARRYQVRPFDPAAWTGDPLAEPTGPPSDPMGGPSGADSEPDPRQLIVDMTASADATLTVGNQDVPLRPAYEGGASQSTDGSVRVELLTPDKTWVHTVVRDAATGQPTPVRVHFRAPDGRYFPPYGHRHEVNEYWFQDYGNDLKIGDTEYAYVDGTFQGELPVGDVYVELSKGFEYRPIRQKVTIKPGQRELSLTLERPLDWRGRGWMTADTHVHFLSPTTAWLQGQAEGLNLVNLLASQWGDLFTNVGDITGDMSKVSDKETIVWVGTENRQHLLGHISMLGTQGDPVYPMTASGPGESYLGDPTWDSLGGWADANHERGGVVVTPHFPNPYSEVVADVILGKTDALEMTNFTPAFDGVNVTEWYKFLNCGYRVPCVGGTDKMSAAMVMGSIRTYAYLGDAPFTFDAWGEAIKAGRTFASTGPLLDLRVEGRRPGDVIDLPKGGGTLAVEVIAESLAPLATIEVVVNGQVVATAQPQPGALSTTMRAQVPVAGSGWIAARCTSNQSGWALSTRGVAAHASPVYVVVDGAELYNPSSATYMLTLLEGGMTWVDTLSIPADPQTHQRVRGVFEQAHQSLHARMHTAGTHHQHAHGHNH